MTDPGAPLLGSQQLSAEQAAQLAADAQARAAAESAVITTTAADSAAQMTERGPLLPAETDIENLMALLRQQSDALASLQKQVGVMAKQTEEAQMAAGGPLTVRYAQAVADKLAAHAAAWPDHDFSGAIAAAGSLVDAAQAVVRGDTSVGGRMQAAESTVRRLLARLPHVDVSAVLDDVALAVEEGLKLAAVV